MSFDNLGNPGITPHDQIAGGFQQVQRIRCSKCRRSFMIDIKDALEQKRQPKCCCFCGVEFK